MRSGQLANLGKQLLAEPIPAQLTRATLSDALKDQVVSCVQRGPASDAAYAHEKIIRVDIINLGAVESQAFR